jgi:molecular chaperone DnaK
MKFGIDFGTTRIIVAVVDRGNYPLVSFDTPEGSFDWLPSLVALRRSGGTPELKFGWDAWHVQGNPEWTVVRSLKRHLEDAGPETVLSIDGGPQGTTEIPVPELLLGLASELRLELVSKFGQREPFEAMIGVPANANNNQRFLTVDAFRRAGFQVLGLLNEPSAAAIEFSHRQKAKGQILVYDLGGGTFDVSLVDVEGGTHTVLACDGISNLGGDDFDQILADLAVAAHPKSEALRSLNSAETFRLEEECRRQKEALHPNSRKIVVDFDHVREGMGQVTVTVADFYAKCRPLLEESLRATSRLAENQSIEALYVTGGGSELPLVGRVLREEFGRKVKRSEYTRSATAIGLAIQADTASSHKIREVFTRNFGVWRESEAGQQMVFDPIFPHGTRLPEASEPPLLVTRTYYPVHNIGHFRYLEASHVGANYQPEGDIAVWDEILFPFDPALAAAPTLEGIPVERSAQAASQKIEECYACDSTGSVKVTIRNLTSNYEREFRLGRWSGKESVIKAGTRQRARKATR